MYANMDFGMLNYNLNTNTVRIAAGKAFDRAIRRSHATRFWARLFGKNNQLIELSGQPVSPRQRIGKIITVPLSQIKGSLGRSSDFDADFNPLKEHNRERWISVASAVMRQIPLPPVELVQVGEIYFVQDGHHRISVAHSLHQDGIEARIVN